MTRLAAFGDFTPLAHSASLARASPVTGFRITSSSRVLVSADDADGLLRTSAVTAFSVPRRMLPTTPITTAPVNTSVMSSTVQLVDHCVDSLRTSQVLARLVAFRRHRPARAVRLAALVVGTTAPRSASPGAGSPVTGFRPTSSSGVRATEGDADSVLRTSAVTAFSVPRRVLPTTPITTAPVNTSVMSSHGATV